MDADYAGTRRLGLSRKLFGWFALVGGVSAISYAQQREVARIPVGQRPWGIAITPDGGRLYAANGLSNDVSVIDVGAARVIATIKVGDGPWGLALRHEVRNSRAGRQ